MQEPTHEEIALWARAFRSARLDEAKRADLGGFFDGKELIALFHVVRSESDRSAALMVTSYVEEILRRAYVMHLSPDVEGGVKELLEGSGPLSTFSSRIKMAHALGWIEKKQAFEINQLRKIRNCFAHEFKINSFSDRPVIDHISNIDKYEKTLIDVVQGEGEEIKASLKPREIFSLRALGLLANVIIMLGTAHTLIGKGLLPHELVVDGHLNIDEAAPIFRQVHYSSALIALSIIQP
jgi:DNA-binding MltR family transcriptional regulator